MKEAGGSVTSVTQDKVTVDTGGELNRLIRLVSDEHGVVLLNNNGDNPTNPDPGDNGGSSHKDDWGGIIPYFWSKPDKRWGYWSPGIIDQLIEHVLNLLGNKSYTATVLNDLRLTKNVLETLDSLGGRTDVWEVSERLGEFNQWEVEDILTDISINMDSFVSSVINK